MGACLVIWDGGELTTFGPFEGVVIVGDFPGVVGFGIREDSSPDTMCSMELLSPD